MADLLVTLDYRDASGNSRRRSVSLSDVDDDRFVDEVAGGVDLLADKGACIEDGPRRYLYIPAHAINSAVFELLEEDK